jgi:hypothetical protein
VDGVKEVEAGEGGKKEGFPEEAGKPSNHEPLDGAGRTYLTRGSVA